MDWKDVGNAVASMAPTLGTLLGGPAGGAIGSLVASALGVKADPQTVQQAISVDPEAAIKLAQIESDQRVKLQELLTDQAKADIAASVAAITEVNKTMQAEAASEHWPTYSWRPFIGFVAGTMIFCVYFVLPVLKLPVPAVPETVWLMLGGILGVASWYRGKMQADPNLPTNNKG